MCKCLKYIFLFMILLLFSFPISATEIDLNELQKSLNSNNVAIRKEAVNDIMFHCDITSPEVMPLLLDVIANDSDEIVRMWAARAFKSTNKLGENEVDFLINVLKNEKSYLVSQTIVEVLGQQQLKKKEAVDVIKKMLMADNPDLRQVSVKALARYEEMAKEALPILAVMLGDPVFRVRINAKNAIKKIKPEADITFLIKQALQYDNLEIKQTALKALFKLEDIRYDELLFILKEIIMKNNEKLQQLSLKILPKLGDKALPVLVDFIWSDTGIPYIQKDALHIIEKMANNKNDILLQFIDHEDIFIRKEVATLLKGEDLKQIKKNILERINDYSNKDLSITEEKPLWVKMDSDKMNINYDKALIFTTNSKLPEFKIYAALNGELKARIFYNEENGIKVCVQELNKR